MTDADAASEPKRPTVAASANQCLEPFQQCLLRASSVHPRELSMVEDQVARFSTWTTGIGVFALGRASMDHRLRYAPEVQSVITGLLESLDYRIRTCSDVLDALGKSPAANAPSVSNEALERSFGDIATEISRLNKISNTIRRASREAQILKVSDFQITDDDGNDVEPLLLDHFRHHIRDRFPNISDTIQRRLARAMLLRRKRILHRRHRQGNTVIRPQKAAPKASITLPAARPTVPSAQDNPQQDDGEVAAVAETTIAPSQIKSATTLIPSKFKMAASSPSVISASKTVALGNHEALNFPPAPGFAAKRKYEAELKDTLKSDLQAIGEITCPYCLYALPAEEVFDERKWQNHVKNDLDPYVCLFEDCDQPDELYSHSDGWLSHLHQHSQRWRCPSHRELGPFSTREEYIQHMREAHNTKLSDTQLRVLANRNTRKMVKLFPSCPLCGKGEAEVDGHLEDHITGHLRSLALKSLPSYQDEIPNDAGSGKDSVDASRPQSRSTVKNLGDDEDMLAFGTEHFWDHWKPQLTETNPTNFLGNAHLELDLSHKDAWMASCYFDKLAFRKSFGSLEDDPQLQSMLQRKKDRAEAIDDQKKNSSDLPADQEAGDQSKAPGDETSGQDEIPSPLEEEASFTSPKQSQHSQQQPSLCVGGLANGTILDSDIEDEDSIATEMQLEYPGDKAKSQEISLSDAGSMHHSPELQRVLNEKAVLARHPTTHMPGIQFGISSAMSTDTSSIRANRGDCQGCVRKRRQGHNNVRERKYCPKHQCSHTDTSGVMCTKRKKAADSYCTIHTPCKVRDCSDPRALDMRGILVDYCANHKCIVVDCDEGKAHDPTKGVYDDLCATHLAQLCKNTACIELKIENGNFCSQHTCAVENCKKKSLSEGGRPFCIEHNKCNRDGCDKPKSQFGSQFEAVCLDHYVPPCIQEACTKKASPSTRFCDLHSCRYTDSKRCKNEARPGRGKPFCADHKCSDVDCQTLRSFSEVEGSLVMNAFCPDRECTEKTYAKHKVPDKPYYMPPCLAESCSQESLSATRYCNLHACRYTDRKRCEKEARPGQGKPFCADHKCSDVDCQTLRSFSEVEGSLVMNAFCPDCECNISKCVKHNVPGKPFCNSHCCTNQGCTRARDGDPRFGTLCYDHHEERIINRAVDERLAEIRLAEEREARAQTARDEDEARRQVVQARRHEEELTELTEREETEDGW